MPLSRGDKAWGAAHVPRTLPPFAPRRQSNLENSPAPFSLDRRVGEQYAMSSGAPCRGSCGGQIRRSRCTAISCILATRAAWPEFTPPPVVRPNELGPPTFCFFSFFFNTAASADDKSTVDDWLTTARRSRSAQLASHFITVDHNSPCRHSFSSLHLAGNCFWLLANFCSLSQSGHRKLWPEANRTLHTESI